MYPGLNCSSEPGFRVVWSLQLEGLDILTGCVGWQLESQAADAGTLGASLRLGELFRLHLAPTTGGATLELVAPGEAPRLNSDWRALALRLAGGSPGAPITGDPAQGFPSLIPTQCTSDVRRLQRSPWPSPPSECTELPQSFPTQDDFSPLLLHPSPYL